MSGTKTVTMTLTKRQRWSYLTTVPLHIYWVPHWPCVTWKMDSGVSFHTLYTQHTNFLIFNLIKRKCSSSFTSIFRAHSSMHYRSRGGQIATRGPHVPRHSVFSGAQKHSAISSNSGVRRKFSWGCFIHWHRIVICSCCALFVTSQCDVIVLLSNQRLSEVRDIICTFFYTSTPLILCAIALNITY